MSKGKSMLSWMVGVMTGTALGMLFAPRKGKEVRDQIRKVRQRGGVGYEPLMEDIKKLSEEMRKYAKDSYKGSPLPEVVKEWRGKLKEFSNEFASDISDFHEEKIAPIQRKTKRVKHQAKTAVRKVKATLRVAKKAAKDVKKIVKK